MEKDDGGQAFPLHIDAAEGMTLRDYFAAHAMQGMIASGQWEMCGSEQSISDVAYDYASRMLARRQLKALY